ncbi:MAG: hypothetical protein AAB818_00525 [Patescibacteria group bacterium]
MAHPSLHRDYHKVDDNHMKNRLMNKTNGTVYISPFGSLWEIGLFFENGSILEYSTVKIPKSFTDRILRRRIKVEKIELNQKEGGVVLTVFTV